MAIYEDDVAIYDSRRPPEPPHLHTRPTTEPRWVKWTLIGIGVVFMALVILMPLAIVFIEAFRKGTEVFFKTFSDRTAQTATERRRISSRRGRGWRFPRRSRARSRAHA